MADVGILLRRDIKAALVINPPLVGEMVFATDTGEHGWLNAFEILVWKDLSVDDDTLLPLGGTTDQVLIKSSDNDGDVTWGDASADIDPDTVIAPAGVLPVLDGSNLTGLPESSTSDGFIEHVFNLGTGESYEDTTDKSQGLFKMTIPQISDDLNINTLKFEVMVNISPYGNSEGGGSNGFYYLGNSVADFCSGSNWNQVISSLGRWEDSDIFTVTEGSEDGVITILFNYDLYDDWICSDGKIVISCVNDANIDWDNVAISYIQVAN